MPIIIALAILVIAAILGVITNPNRPNNEF